MSIGGKIKAAREAMKMTQEELGAACGTTKQTIFKYESGIVTNIPLDRLECIAEILNVCPAYLMGWDRTDSDDKNKPAGPELDELDRELMRLSAHLTPEQKRRQVETLKDIVGNRDN